MQLEVLIPQKKSCWFAGITILYYDGLFYKADTFIFSGKKAIDV
jgi:hypothetical protein